MLKNWQVTAPQLARKSTLQVYALNFDLADVPEAERAPEDLEQMKKFDDYATQNSDELVPRFTG